MAFERDGASELAGAQSHGVARPETKVPGLSWLNNECVSAMNDGYGGASGILNVKLWLGFIHLPHRNQREYEGREGNEDPLEKKIFSFQRPPGKSWGKVVRPGWSRVHGG